MTNIVDLVEKSGLSREEIYNSLILNQRIEGCLLIVFAIAFWVVAYSLLSFLKENKNSVLVGPGLSLFIIILIASILMFRSGMKRTINPELYYLEEFQK